jgi:hypothetical protein
MRLHGIHVGWTAKSATTAYSVVVLNGTDTVATVSLPTGSGADSTQAVGASLSNREMTKNTALIVQVIGPATDATITGLNVAVSGHTLDHVNADRAND